MRLLESPRRITDEFVGDAGGFSGSPENLQHSVLTIFDIYIIIYKFNAYDVPEGGSMNDEIQYT